MTLKDFSSRLNLHRSDPISAMPHWKFSKGFIYTAAGWLLSAWSLLGAVGYIMRQISGIGETPDFVLIGLWVILIIGGVLSYFGSKLLQRGVLVAFPIVTAGVILVLLYIALPTIVCSYSRCIPAGSPP